MRERVHSFLDLSAYWNVVTTKSLLSLLHLLQEKPGTHFDSWTNPGPYSWKWTAYHHVIVNQQFQLSDTLKKKRPKFTTTHCQKMANLVFAWATAAWAVQTGLVPVISRSQPLLGSYLSSLGQLLLNQFILSFQGWEMEVGGALTDVSELWKWIFRIKIGFV